MYWGRKVVLFGPRVKFAVRVEDECCNDTRSKSPLSRWYTWYFLWHRLGFLLWNVCPRHAEFWTRYFMLQSLFANSLVLYHTLQNLRIISRTYALSSTISRPLRTAGLKPLTLNPIFRVKKPRESCLCYKNNSTLRN